MKWTEREETKSFVDDIFTEMAFYKFYRPNYNYDDPVKDILEKSFKAVASIAKQEEREERREKILTLFTPVPAYNHAALFLDDGGNWVAPIHGCDTLQMILDLLSSPAQEPEEQTIIMEYGDATIYTNPDGTSETVMNDKQEESCEWTLRKDAMRHTYYETSCGEGRPSYLVPKLCPSCDLRIKIKESER